MIKHTQPDIPNHGCITNATEPPEVYRYTTALRAGKGFATVTETNPKMTYRTELCQIRNI